MSPLYAPEQLFENVKSAVISAGFALHNAKLHHLQAQEDEKKLKRAEINQFVSWCERPSERHTNLNAEQIAYNNKLLQRYFGTKNNLDQIISDLRFNIYQHYLETLEVAKRRLEALSQETHFSHNLQITDFFIDIADFNQRYATHLDEGVLYRQQEDFQGAIERWNRMKGEDNREALAPYSYPG